MTVKLEAKRKIVFYNNNDSGSIIIEVDEVTHDMILKKEKLNIGWRKCSVFSHFSIKKCFKWWGLYHIARNCKREEICHKCAGKHTAVECREGKQIC